MQLHRNLAAERGKQFEIGGPIFQGHSVRPGLQVCKNAGSNHGDGHVQAGVGSFAPRGNDPVPTK